MVTQFDLLKAILNLSKDDTALLVESMAFFDIKKAEQFKFFLDSKIREEDERRLKEAYLLKSRAMADRAMKDAA